MNRLYFIFISFICFNTADAALPEKSKEVIEQYMNNGLYHKALDEINNIQESYPNHPELLLLKGICYYKSDDLKAKAPEILQNAIEANTNKKDHPNILFHLAKAHQTNLEYKNAIDIYTSLQEITPEDYEDLREDVDREIAVCIRKLEESKEENRANNKQYTIQICTLNAPLTDSFFEGKYNIKYIKVGELYRYIYSAYPSLDEAQKDLSKVKKIYPAAFIREFNEEKLGKAINLNTYNIK